MDDESKKAKISELRATINAIEQAAYKELENFDREIRRLEEALYQVKEQKKKFERDVKEQKRELERRKSALGD
jgi:septal ring factor EnvC (AmiA/AmiB activator)